MTQKDGVIESYRGLQIISAFTTPPKDYDYWDVEWKTFGNRTILAWGHGKNHFPYYSIDRVFFNSSTDAEDFPNSHDAMVTNQNLVSNLYSLVLGFKNIRFGQKKIIYSDAYLLPRSHHTSGSRIEHLSGYRIPHHSLGASIFFGCPAPLCWMPSLDAIYIPPVNQEENEVTLTLFRGQYYWRGRARSSLTAGDFMGQQFQGTDKY